MVCQLLSQFLHWDKSWQTIFIARSFSFGSFSFVHVNSTQHMATLMPFFWILYFNSFLIMGSSSEEKVQGCLYPRGVSALGGGVCSGGSDAPRGSALGGGLLLQPSGMDFCSGAVSALGGVCSGGLLCGCVAFCFAFWYGLLVWWPSGLDQVQVHTQEGNWNGSGWVPHPRGKLRGIRSRLTPKGEVKVDLVQAHNQGGSWRGSDQGVTALGVPALGGVETPLPVTATAAGCTHPNPAPLWFFKLVHTNLLLQCGETRSLD